MTYQLTGEAAYITTTTAFGKAKIFTHRGALIADDAPELPHLLKMGMAAKVDDEVTGGLNADGDPDAVADGTVVPDPSGTQAFVPAEQAETSTGHGQSVSLTNGEESGDGDTAARREAAREKLAKLGGKAPDGRHSEDVLIEYLVGQGSSYDDLVNTGKSDLLELVKSRQP
ncbi:hypothetical protein [Verrucosispora sp. TAA-831]|uniref:hypothetical protein n=1 Tax=Verrucosispora sp. TAA-831 TaxID=3422227 RepID=UPI003D6E04AA